MIAIWKGLELVVLILKDECLCPYKSARFSNNKTNFGSENDKLIKKLLALKFEKIY